MEQAGEGGASAGPGGQEPGEGRDQGWGPGRLHHRGGLGGGVRMAARPHCLAHRPTQLAVVPPLGDGVERLATALAALLLLVPPDLGGPPLGLKLWETHGTVSPSTRRGGCVIPGRHPQGRTLMETRKKAGAMAMAAPPLPCPTARLSVTRAPCWDAGPAWGQGLSRRRPC